MKNAQLWKRIVTRGIEADDGCQMHDAASFVNRVMTVPIIHIGRICFETYQQHQWSDFVGMSLPFQEFWVERIMTIGGKDFPFGSFVSAWRGIDGGIELELVMVNGNTSAHVTGSLTCKLNADGDLIREDQGFSCSYATWLLKQHGQTKAEKCHCSELKFVLATMLLLSCSNIRLSTQEVPERTKFTAKRHGGDPHPAFRYHTLRVTKKVSAGSESSREIGLMPEHVCRGHFKHYGPAASHRHPDGQDRGLLFGKHAGKFYDPPSVKGDEKNGIIEKDYEVRA